MKTNWKDVDMRLPNRMWQVGRCCRFLESLLGLVEGTIAFRHPDGTEANDRDIIGSFRNEEEKEMGEMYSRRLG